MAFSEEFSITKKLLLATLVVWVVLGPVAMAGEADDDQELRTRIEALSSRIAELEKRGALGPSDFRVYWEEGLRFQTPDKDFTLKIGGKIMNDWAWMQAAPAVEAAVGDLEDGTEFRSAGLYIAGTIYENVDFKLEFDFAGGDADLKDAYIGIRGLPVYVKAGHFKEAFGLEELTSSKYITFIERSLPRGVFGPSRNTGFAVNSDALDKRVTWAAGIFRETDGYGDGQAEGAYNVTGRITALPRYADDGRNLLHLGASASYRGGQDALSFDGDPEVHLAPDFVDTGDFASDSHMLVGGEVALVKGPLSLQGEIMAAEVNRTGGDATFYGYYAQASYFLTGEHRKYKKSSGAFDRIKPKKNFGKKGGPGAWEVAARYSYVDLTDAGIDGGELKDITVGLNWYLNPNARVMWNYVQAKLDGPGAADGDADLFVMRLQIDF
jgi:phosphate-selective porin OprO/OprP